jgi:hypothetical protein
MARRRDNAPAQDVVITVRVRGAGTDLSVPCLRFYQPGEGTLRYFSSGDEGAAPMRQVTLGSVITWLCAAGLSDLPGPVVEGLRTYLCPLTIPRLEELTPIPDQPAPRLHNLLPKAEAAAKDFGAMMRTIAKICDQHSGKTEIQDSPEYLARMERVINFIEAAQGLAEILPPKPPREVKWWHDDARWIASFLIEVGRDLGRDIGVTKADRAGARFIADALHGLAIATVTPAAVAQAIRRSADN